MIPAHSEKPVSSKYKIEEMTAKEILEGVGHFSQVDASLFEKNIKKKSPLKGDLLLQEGDVCQSVYFVLKGSFVQFQTNDTGESIIDLHTETDWVFNYPSLINQTASTATIKAFERSEVLELNLINLHHLIAGSASFLQFTSLFNQVFNRIHMFDHSLNPAKRYEHLKRTKPQVIKVFPVKWIASYLKIAPETLSRIRAKS